VTTVKTAISVQEALFEQADEIADEMKISRSRLFNLALEDFVLRYHNRKLLKQINAAYEDLPDPGEQERRLKMLQIQKRLVDSEWK
jgi:metal-responsive CopG/Arc/MetJ family transcriptional regulator